MTISVSCILLNLIIHVLCEACGRNWDDSLLDNIKFLFSQEIFV